MQVLTGSYKGQPTITLDPNGKWPFTFGVAKAKKILAALPEIQAFVAANEKPQPGPAAPPATNGLPPQNGNGHSQEAAFQAAHGRVL